MWYEKNFVLLIFDCIFLALVFNKLRFVLCTFFNMNVIYTTISLLVSFSHQILFDAVCEVTLIALPHFPKHVAWEKIYPTELPIEKNKLSIRFSWINRTQEFRGRRLYLEHLLKSNSVPMVLGWGVGQKKTTVGEGS